MCILSFFNKNCDLLRNESSGCPEEIKEYGIYFDSAVPVDLSFQFHRIKMLNSLHVSVRSPKSYILGSFIFAK